MTKKPKNDVTKICNEPGICEFLKPILAFGCLCSGQRRKVLKAKCPQQHCCQSIYSKYYKHVLPHKMGFGVQLYYISRFKSYCKQVFQKEAKWLFTPFQCLQYLGHTFDSYAVLLAQFLALDYLYGAICAFKRMKSALDSSRKYKTKKAVPPPSIWQLNKLVSCIFYYPQKKVDVTFCLSLLVFLKNLLVLLKHRHQPNQQNACVGPIVCFFFDIQQRN